jgi:SAM-dependent methyltransferase
MTIQRDTTVEAGVLKTFQTHLPSVYFDDKSDPDFQTYRERIETFYRMRLQFPPEMFAGKTLLDLGAGTGHNSVHLARWGAKCTLVEMNKDAQDVCRRIFERYAGDGEHEFILSSLFEWDDERHFDIVHSRGVFSHTSNKEGAFAKLASHLKEGGYLIFGDPNRAGGFQNMLQRWILYRFSKDWQELEALSERLFKDDIDRSQAAIWRTRGAIIYDRWVVPQQDDPSIREVLEWMKQHGLQFYSAWPRFTPPVFGDSLHHRTILRVEELPHVGAAAELIWMMQNEEDAELVPQLLAPQERLADALQALTDYVGDVRPDTKLDAKEISARVRELSAAAQTDQWSAIARRLAGFFAEVDKVVRAVETGSIDDTELEIRRCKHLFRGAVGLRHADLVAYKPVQ